MSTVSITGGWVGNLNRQDGTSFALYPHRALGSLCNVEVENSSDCLHWLPSLPPVPPEVEHEGGFIGTLIHFQGSNEL